MTCKKLHLDLDPILAIIFEMFLHIEVLTFMRRKDLFVEAQKLILISLEQP